MSEDTNKTYAIIEKYDEIRVLCRDIASTCRSIPELAGALEIEVGTTIALDHRAIDVSNINWNDVSAYIMAAQTNRRDT